MLSIFILLLIICFTDCLKITEITDVYACVGKNCVSLDQADLKTMDCYDDYLPVSFKINDNLTSGYLNQYGIENKILTEQKKLTVCQKLKR